MARSTPAATVIDIGIDEKDRKRIAEGLSRLLADNFALYLKTHNFHWNVKGPMFQTLHVMFEAQYNELWTALDAIADPAVERFQPAWSTRAHLLADAGRTEAAADAYRVAIELTTDQGVADYLREQLTSLSP